MILQYLKKLLNARKYQMFCQFVNDSIFNIFLLRFQSNLADFINVLFCCQKYHQFFIHIVIIAVCVISKISNIEFSCYTQKKTKWYKSTSYTMHLCYVCSLQILLFKQLLVCSSQNYKEITYKNKTKKV